ncbi:MAG: ABC transporter ATP-binding protein [Rhabdochlamydiaceae bacterium]|nr:ABC transporter ATP-binding protein [Rhabdochlamydiaceae bacterium]
MKPILKAQNLKKTYKTAIDVTVLDGISLEVLPGETIAIIGKSGEGKTTLLHLLGTLEKPTSGTIEVCGEVATSQNSPYLRNTHIGFVFQAYHLLEECTVLENVLMPARIAKQDIRPGSSAHTRALMLLEEVGLSHRRDFLAKLLSGGEKQRAAIARALINNPSIILADEPSGNLDHAHSQDIYKLLLNEAQKRNKALVVVTHDLSLASQCQKTYALQDGVLS